jgi:hypothetical protein
LARLGNRPRITEDVVRRVSRTFPLVDVNWGALRDQVNNQADLFDPNSEYLRKLVASLRSLNLDLADLFPPLLEVTHARESGHELVTQLRLLHSTVGVKLDQFDRAFTRPVLLRRSLGRSGA